MRKGGGEKQEWDSTCQHYTGYTEAELEELVLCFDVSAQIAESDQHCKNIFKKYSHAVFFKVAQLPPLKTIAALEAEGTIPPPEEKKKESTEV